MIETSPHNVEAFRPRRVSMSSDTSTPNPRPRSKLVEAWTKRTSLLRFPPLTTSNIDQHQPSAARRPVESPTALGIQNPTLPPFPPTYEEAVPSGLEPQWPLNPGYREQDRTPPPSISTVIPSSFLSSPESNYGSPPPPPPRAVKRGHLTKAQPPTQAVETPRSASSQRPENVVAQRQAKLHKASLDSHSSSQAHTRSASASSISSSARPPRHASPAPEFRGRNPSAREMPALRTSASASRLGPSPINTARTVSQDRRGSPSRGSPSRLKRTLIPRSRSNSIDIAANGGASAWILDGATRTEYPVAYLGSGEKVPELWNDREGDVLVFLYPKSSGCGPSFKVPQYAVGSSHTFAELILSGRDSPGGSDRGPPGPPLQHESGETYRLYLPAPPPSTSGQPLSAPGQATPADTQRLVTIRNLFAFMTGQVLVATKSCATLFAVLMSVADLLHEFNYHSQDEWRFGEAAHHAFEFYVEKFNMQDCRHSREKTLEMLILGERMQSRSLFYEAFCHAAGKHHSIMEIQSPLYNSIQPSTKEELENTSIAFGSRQVGVNNCLQTFDFPSMWAGIASSTSDRDLRVVRFKVWRSAYTQMRTFILKHYKSTLGSWPPKASSKKNPFMEGGLNRLVLKVLYSDMCSLYDLLVDRTQKTSRASDHVPAIDADAPAKSIISALRTMMSAHDRSSVPVVPPVPHDLPRLPLMSSVMPNYDSLSPKDQVKHDKRVKDNELLLVLNKAYDHKMSLIETPFLKAFKDFELREARGKSGADIFDQRIGYWLFMYAVIQTLPILVVDAPALQFTEGTEYFLSMAPNTDAPWMMDASGTPQRRMIQGSNGFAVSQNTHASLKRSPEAIYARSHCWQAAKRWEEDGEHAPPPVQQTAFSPLAPPNAIFQGSDVSAPILPPGVGGASTPPPPPGGPGLAIRPQRVASPGPDYFTQRLHSGDSGPIGGSQGGHSRQSSLTQQMAQSQTGSRVGSVGSLATLNPQNPRASAQPSSATSSSATFDTILAGTQDTAKEKEKEKSTEKKKRGLFFK